MPSKALVYSVGAVIVGGAAVALAARSAQAKGPSSGSPPPAGAKPPVKAKPRPPAASAPAGAKPPGASTPAPAPAAAPPVNGPPVKTETTFPTTEFPGSVPTVVIKPDDIGHMAGELALHLTTLQLATGGPKQAKGHENKTLVRTFQKAAGLTVDGESGPATFIGIAKHAPVGQLPLVMYWPKAANAKTVLAYRTAIRAIADSAPAPVAEALRASANRERGQGGINGPLATDVSAAGATVPAS